MEKDIEPGNKPTLRWSTDLNKGVEKIHKERTVSLANGAGKTGYPYAKWQHSTHFTKKSFWNALRLNKKIWIYKTPGRKHKEKTPWLWSWTLFLGYDTKSIDNKSKNRQVKVHQTKTLQIKGNNQRVERQPTESKKIFTNHLSKKELLYFSVQNL